MTSLVVRIDEDLKAELQQLADADERSLSNYIRLVLKKAVESEKKG